MDVAGRLLEQVQQYAMERGITDEEAASELLSFALMARCKSPKKKPGRLLRFPR